MTDHDDDQRPDSRIDNNAHDPPDDRDHLDGLIDDLAVLAMEEHAGVVSDPRWEALAAGRLDPADTDALEAWARDDDEAAAALEAFRPPDDLTFARMERRFVELATRPVSAPAKATASPRRSSVLRWAMAAGPLLAAAVIILVVLPPSERTRDLPAYAISVRGGEALGHSIAPKASASPTLRLMPGSRLELVLTPATRVGTKPAIRAFLVAADGVRPWPIEPRISEQGAIQIAGTVESLGLGDVPPGEWEIRLALGPAETAPADLTHLPDNLPPGWQLFSARVLLAARP